MIAEVRARRLAEVRKRQNATQVEVAAAMGVSQARVFRIEKGPAGKERSRDPGRLREGSRRQAEDHRRFGDESYALG
jgi:transcriptional regulator with XRE-family HTH domain